MSPFLPFEWLLNSFIISFCTSLLVYPFDYPVVIGSNEASAFTWFHFGSFAGKMKAFFLCWDLLNSRQELNKESRQTPSLDAVNPTVYLIDRVEVNWWDNDHSRSWDNNCITFYHLWRQLDDEINKITTWEISCISFVSQQAWLLHNYPCYTTIHDQSPVCHSDCSTWSP